MPVTRSQTQAARVARQTAVNLYKQRLAAYEELVQLTSNLNTDLNVVLRMREIIDDVLLYLPSSISYSAYRNVGTLYNKLIRSTYSTDNFAQEIQEVADKIYESLNNSTTLNFNGTDYIDSITVKFSNVSKTVYPSV